MKRAETIKALGNIYGIEILANDIKNVGATYHNRKNNELFDKVLNSYSLLMSNLYVNKARLKDVTKVYVMNNIIYYDMIHLPNFELISI